MKAPLDLINQDPVFVGDFENESQVFGSFEVSDKEKAEYKILFASYDTPSYDGYAWGLCIKKGTADLLEFSGSHCSCYGLEGQFTPEPVVLAELQQRLTKGTFGDDAYKKEAIEFLGITNEN